MADESYAGPRIGDRVRVEAGGLVRELQARGGVAGVLVELDDEAGDVWMPLDAVVLLRQPGG